MLHTNIKSKKSQGLPLTTIVIAALVIIVLIVLIAIFSNKIGFISKSLDDCKSKNGEKIGEDEPCEDGVKIPIKGTDQYCCIKTFKQ